MIYESRPNVTLDAFALAFKSGNAIILKGGGEIVNSNKVLSNLIVQTLKNNKVDLNVIQDVSFLKKEQIKFLIEDSSIDCLIPRGGKGLIEYVKNNAKVPCIITGASVVHTYVSQYADLEIAQRVILNAKTRRVSICNALDVLLVHQDIYQKLLENISGKMAANNIELRADKKSYLWLKRNGYPNLRKSSSKDFDTEFLDYILAIKTVGSLAEALSHIEKHSLGHSEAIITSSDKEAADFFREIDAACLYRNTSTQFSDGGEFGMGGEIGISTQKLHARGPFAYRELTTYKYLVESDGSTRK